MGTVLIMPTKKPDKDTVRPIRFCLEEVIDRYNATRQKKDHLTLYKIEKLTGLSATTTWRHRTGQSQGIDWDTLAKYCEVLECTPGDLLSYKRGSIKLEKKNLK